MGTGHSCSALTDSVHVEVRAQCSQILALAGEGGSLLLFGGGVVVRETLYYLHRSKCL